MEKRLGEIIFLFAVFTALAGLCFFIAPTGLASNEEGVQYVQMKNFVLNGSIEITGPGQRLGFDAGDVAGMRSFLVSRDGRLFASPPPLFPWIASVVSQKYIDKVV